MKTLFLIILSLTSHFAKAELANLYCFNGDQQKASIQLEELMEMDAHYVLSFNFSEGNVETSLKRSGDENFVPLKVLSKKTDEYGDVLLSDLVMSLNSPKGGSMTNAFKIQSYEDSCEGKIISIEKGIYGGFAGMFTPNLAKAADLCFCETD